MEKGHYKMERGPYKMKRGPYMIERGPYRIKKWEYKKMLQYDFVSRFLHSAGVGHLSRLRQGSTVGSLLCVTGGSIHSKFQI